MGSPHAGQIGEKKTPPLFVLGFTSDHQHQRPKQEGTLKLGKKGGGVRQRKKGQDPLFQKKEPPGEMGPPKQILQNNIVSHGKGTGV